MDIIKPVADAVVAMLNAATLSKIFEAARIWDTDLELAAADGLRVDVVAAGLVMDADGVTRDLYRDEVSVEIAVRKRLGTVTNQPGTGKIFRADVDEYVAFTQEVCRYLRKRANQWLDTDPAAYLTKIEIPVLPLPEHLDDLRQFTAIARATYVVDTVGDE